MYQPAHFQETDRSQHLKLIRDYPLALLVTTGDAGTLANPIPFIINDEATVLRAHMARANGQWKTLEGPTEALVIFQGPQTYISPGFYASKKEHGRVVPTWNYAIVQVRGTLRVIEEAEWIAQQINDLTDQMEASEPHVWAVKDAPEPFIAAQIRGIVGLEISISTIEGKWKMSQNRSLADRQGVVEGLEARGETTHARIVADYSRKAE